MSESFVILFVVFSALLHEPIIDIKIVGCFCIKRKKVNVVFGPSEICFILLEITKYVNIKIWREGNYN